MTTGTSSREAMLQAVASVLEDEGLSGLSLRKVAARAGFSHAAPGVVFGDRAGLLTAFATMGFHRFARSLQEKIDAAPDGPAALSIATQGYILFAAEEPDLFQIMFRTELLRENDTAYLDGVGRVHSCVMAAVDRCIADGFVNADMRESTGLLVWSTLHGVVMLWTNGRLTRCATPQDITGVAEHTAQQLVELVRGR